MCTVVDVLGEDMNLLSSSLSRWEYWEYFGAAIVILGVTGEFIAVFTKLLGDKSKRRQMEKVSTLVLIFGLAIELVGLVKTSQIAGEIIARLNVKAGEAMERATKLDLARVELEKQVEELRKENAKLQPRIITVEQRTASIAALVNSPKGHIGIGTINGDSETNEYAEQIRKMLRSAGFNVNEQADLNSQPGNFPKGIQMSVSNPTNCPIYAVNMQRAFASVGIKAIGFIDKKLATNQVEIIVGSKP